MNMQLKSVHLEAQDWGVNKGKLLGHLTVAGEYGEIKITIDQDKAAGIVALLADALVATAQETGRMMAAQIIDQANNGVPLLVDAAA